MDLLIHRRTYVLTQRAIRGCSVVAYTSIAVVGPTPLLVPPTSAGCTLVFTSAETTRVISHTPVVAIRHLRTNATLRMSPRRFSKIPKLCPHLLFGQRTTVFFDTKLHMRAPLTVLGALARRGMLTAFRHPRCAETSCDPYVWMEKEVDLLASTRRVEDHRVLREQLRRYLQTEVNRSCKMYIEGGLLIQQAADALFRAWSAEVFAERTSDRDQVAFAYVCARDCVRVNALHPSMPCQVVDGRRLCHWYTDASVARLKRANLDVPRPHRRL